LVFGVKFSFLEGKLGIKGKKSITPFEEKRLSHIPEPQMATKAIWLQNTIHPPHFPKTIRSNGLMVQI
jgi:hypothetical protein